MRQAIALCFLIGLFNVVHGQQSSCKLEPGDSCHVDNTGTVIRTSANYNYKIIDTIDDVNADVNAVVLQTKVINGYVKVKLLTDTIANPEMAHLYEHVGWIKKGYLHCFIPTKTREFGTPSEAWDEDIALAENYKSRQLCKYSKDWHARLLLDKGRALYAEENYEEAEKNISRAINLLRYHDNLCIFYWFRAHARTELGEYVDAIEDFDYIIDNKDFLEADTSDYDLNDVLCWKAQNLYLINETYKAKSILKIVIASDPVNGFAYYLMGLVKFANDDKPGCCKDLSRAVELGFEEAIDAIAEKCN